MFHGFLIRKGDDDQPRDENGRWASDGGAGSTPIMSVREITGGPNPWIEINAEDGSGNKIGSIQASRTDTGKELQIREANVTGSQQGKGNGKALYRAAFDYAEKHGLEVRSDTATSVSADRVWQSLAKVTSGITRAPNVELDASLGKYYATNPMTLGDKVFHIRSGEPVWRYKPQ